jgi:hypothetical protein
MSAFRKDSDISRVMLTGSLTETIGQKHTVVSGNS